MREAFQATMDFTRPFLLVVELVMQLKFVKLVLEECGLAPGIPQITHHPRGGSPIPQNANPIVCEAEGKEKKNNASLQNESRDIGPMGTTVMPGSRSRHFVHVRSPGWLRKCIVSRTMVNS